jgi:hypothetical protein
MEEVYIEIAYSEMYVLYLGVVASCTHEHFNCTSAICSKLETMRDMQMLKYPRLLSVQVQVPYLSRCYHCAKVVSDQIYCSYSPHKSHLDRC